MPSKMVMPTTNTSVADAPQTAARRAVFAATGGDLISVETAKLQDFGNYYNFSVMNPKVLVGCFLGAMATLVFCALTMKAVGRAARGMVEEVRRQFKEMPGIMDHTQKPDYSKAVDMLTKAAIREMVIPSLLPILVPLAVGLLLGPQALGGVLLGTIVTGLFVAISMTTGGGAWDGTSPSWCPPTPCTTATTSITSPSAPTPPFTPTATMVSSSPRWWSTG